MTATLDGVTNKKAEPAAEQKAAEDLVRRAREQGLSLRDLDGLLKQLTKTVLETALNQEMTEHLGHEEHGPVVSETGHTRIVSHRHYRWQPAQPAQPRPNPAYGMITIPSWVWRPPKSATLKRTRTGPIRKQTSLDPLPADWQVRAAECAGPRSLPRPASATAPNRLGQ